MLRPLLAPVLRPVLSFDVSASPQGGGVPANALTSKTGDVLTDKSGSITLTAKAA